jgi:hypothetical protein
VDVARLAPIYLDLQLPLHSREDALGHTRAQCAEYHGTELEQCLNQYVLLFDRAYPQSC